MGDSAVRWRLIAALGAVMSTVLVGVAVIRPRWEPGGQELMEGWALFAVFCVPAAFALLACLNRPALLMTGAAVSMVTSPLLGILAPILWGFAALYGAAFVSQPARRSFAPAWLVVALPALAALVGGSFIILGAREMSCVTTVVERGTAVECGETTMAGGTTATLVLVAFAVAAGVALSSPRQRPSEA